MSYYDSILYPEYRFVRNSWFRRLIPEIDKVRIGRAVTDICYEFDVSAATVTSHDTVRVKIDKHAEHALHCAMEDLGYRLAA